MKPDDAYRVPVFRTDSLESVLESLDNLSQWWHRFREHEFDNTRSWIGPVVDEYRASRNAAKDGLQSHNRLYRIGSLYVLMYHWDKSADIVQICEKLAMNDPDDAVKIQAIMYISDFYRASADRRVARLMSKIVISEMEGTEIRAAAYRGLLLVMQLDLYNITKITNIRFPDDVNWTIVRQYELEP